VIRILVVDDHAVVRQGIARLLEEAPDLVLVGEAADGAEGRRLALDVEADVCVLDLAMPGGGVELVAELHELLPRLRILVFSMHREEHYALRVLAAGAGGFLSKDSPPTELAEAVRAVASGRRYLSHAVAEQMAERLIDGTTDAPHERLSPRELEVFRRLARGEGPSEIAAALGLSVKSVSTYRSRVLEKLGFRRNADLTRYALEHDLLD
jgi:two-component system, NarL family, invasion response regulator UvrY